MSDAVLDSLWQREECLALKVGSLASSYSTRTCKARTHQLEQLDYLFIGYAMIDQHRESCTPVVLDKVHGKSFSLLIIPICEAEQISSFESHGSDESRVSCRGGANSRW